MSREAASASSRIRAQRDAPLARRASVARPSASRLTGVRAAGEAARPALGGVRATGGGAAASRGGLDEVFARLHRRRGYRAAAPRVVQLHYLAETFISRREEWVFVPVVSIKLTEAQARALAKRVKERGYPSKSEFLRYAIMRALEDNLSVAALEDVFESRRQIRKGKTVSLDELMLED